MLISDEADQKRDLIMLEGACEMWKIIGAVGQMVLGS